jgi:hypothetical protein
LPETQYTYTVTARDKSTNQNETAASAEASATTDPESTVSLTSDPIILNAAENGASSSGDGPDSVCPTTYDVYFGQDNPPTTQIAGDIYDAVCDPGVLESFTTYYWQVVAKNCCEEIVGPVWSFTTDNTPPEIICPGDISVSSMFGGAVVTYEPTAIDSCDPDPVVTTDIPSGSVFEKGVTAVTVTAVDASGNSSSCTFDVIVSCFGINEVKIINNAGKPGHGPKHGHGPKRRPRRRPKENSEIEIKGTFNAAVPIDLAVDDVLYVVDDGQGNVLEFFIPAGSFELHGKGKKHNPADQKFEFHSHKKDGLDLKANFDLDKCRFELKAKKAVGLEGITGGELTVTMQVGINACQETVELKGHGKSREKHLEYKAKPKPECCQW